MITIKEIADPVVGIRNVLETFRLYGITVENWAEILGSAAAHLRSAAHRTADSSQYLALSEKIDIVLSEGLDRESSAFQEAARMTADMASEIRVPGVPTPDDADWSF